MIKNEKVNTKKNISTRSNFRAKKKIKAKPQGIKDYYAQRLQDSQTFSRINRDRVADSLAHASGLYSPEDQTEEYEYKPIDSQIGSLMKQRDYTVDRTQMRNQRNNANLASLVVSGGGKDSAISPNPIRPYMNDSIMFKSMNKNKSPMAATMYNAKSMVGALNNNDRPGVRSPGKDSRNIKLDPIDISKNLNLI